MGPGPKMLTQVWSGHFITAQFWTDQGQSPLGLENFPLKIPNFSIFCPSGQETPGSKIGRPLINCGSKVCTSWITIIAYNNNNPVQYGFNRSLLLKSSFLKESLQMTIAPTGSALLIFWQPEVEKLLMWPRIEPTTVDLSSQSDAFDYMA